jgi:hypothetical protein
VLGRLVAGRGRRLPLMSSLELLVAMTRVAVLVRASLCLRLSLPSLTAAQLVMEAGLFPVLSGALIFYCAQLATLPVPAAALAAATATAASSAMTDGVVEAVVESRGYGAPLAMLHALPPVVTLLGYALSPLPAVCAHRRLTASGCGWSGCSSCCVRAC